VKVSSLAKREEEIVIRMGDEPDDLVHVVYRPGQLTLEIADKVKEIMGSGFEHDIALAMLEPLLVRWDLENEDGTPYPLNHDTLRKVPLEFLGLILARIESDARPRPTRGEMSDDISPQTENSENSTTGTSSEEPQGSGESHRGTSLIDPSDGST